MVATVLKWLFPKILGWAVSQPLAPSMVATVLKWLFPKILEWAVSQPLAPSLVPWHSICCQKIETRVAATCP
jgi:hypothetical protein